MRNSIRRGNPICWILTDTMNLDSRGKMKLYSIISALFALIILFITLLLPKAEVLISIKERQFKKTYSVILDNTISVPLAPINRIPYSTLTETNAFKEHIITFINEKITSEIDLNSEHLDEDALRYTLEITDKEHAIAELYVDSIILPKIDTAALKKLIRGKKIKEARDNLERLPYIKSSTITLIPEFLGFVPLIGERITITYE